MSAGALNVAATAMTAAQTAMEVEANNIANMQTGGYKKVNVATSDLFYRTLRPSGTFENADLGRRPTGVQIGSGSRIEGTYRNMTQGDVINSGDPLHFLINGAGYFAVTIPGNTGKNGYTRDGRFKVNDQRMIVDHEGRAVLTAQGAELIVPDTIVDYDTIGLEADGTLAGKDTANARVAIGAIGVFTFPNPQGLDAAGTGVFLDNDASGEPVALDDISDKLKSRIYESSNVDVATSMVDIINYTRLFELASRIMEADKDMAASALKN